MKQEMKKEEVALVLMQMLHETPLETLRVKDLLERANISKSSFYRMFLDKYEAANWVYRKQADEIVGNMPNLSGWKDWTYVLHDYMREHRAFFRNIASYRGQNSFQDFLTEYFYGNTVNFRENRQETVSEDQRFAVHAFCLVAAQTTVNWVLNGFDLDDETIIHRMELCIPECIRPFYQKNA